MNSHTDLLNLIAAKIGAKTYVEIGVFNPDHNFNHINVKHKIAVDPDPTVKATINATSDQAFSMFKELNAKADLVFVDGLHHAVQAKPDVQNAWDILNPGGVIVIHDSNPHSEHITHVPRDNREWCGDVYKMVSQLKCATKMTVDFDYGCCVIRKEIVTDGKATGTVELLWTGKEVSWEEFDQNRTELLHLVSVEEALRRIDAWK